MLVAWKRLLIIVPLHRELGLMLVILTAMMLLLLLLAISPMIPLLMFLLLTTTPAGPQLLLSNSHAGETAATPPLTVTSPAMTLPKITNGKRMEVARRWRRRRHLRFLQLLHITVGLRCANSMLYECSCDVGRGEGRAFLDIVVIRQLVDNYLNNFLLRVVDTDNPHGVDEFNHSCQKQF